MTALLALCVLALGFGITWLVFHTRAQRIAARRTQELERATGVPAAEILRDLLQGSW